MAYKITSPLEITNQSNVNDGWLFETNSNQRILSIRSDQQQTPTLILSSDLNQNETDGWLNVSSISAFPNTLQILGNVRVLDQVQANIFTLENISTPNTLSLIASNQMTQDIVLNLPPTIGSNGNCLRSLGDGQTEWANASLSLFNASVDIVSLVSTGPPTNNFNIKLSSNANIYTPNAPLISITNPGPSLSDLIEVPSGRTFLRAWGIIQLQFPLLGASQQRAIFNLVTTTGSGSRGTVATIPASSNNWRISPSTEVQGVTSNVSSSLAWGIANVVPILLSNSFISIQYY